MNKIYNEDCLETMGRMSDNSIDLVLTDPPYGINIIKNGRCGGADSKSKKAKMGDYSFTDNLWDKEKPKKEIFDEIFRVSKNQIIFGANHFIESMPINSSCWIVWDKDNPSAPFADCELAWTSFNTAVRKFTFMWNGMLQQNMKDKEKRYHPTQKPIQLFSWLLNKYSKPSDIIYDPFMGSGTTALASIKNSRKWVGSEMSKEYCDISNERIKQELSQIRLPLDIQSHESVFDIIK